MSREDCIKKLKSIVSGERGEEVIHTRTNRSMLVDKFCERFEGAEVSYESLTGHYNCESGWLNIFDEWKDRGILN